MIEALKGWAGRLALIAIGIVFLIAGGVKALDPAGFVDQVGRYKVLPAALAPWLAYTLVPFEIALGAALIVDYRRRWAVGAAVVLLAGFVALLGWTWAAGGDVTECGCFGQIFERTPLESLVEDLIFIGIALLGLLAPTRRWEGGMGRGAVVVAAAAATLVVMVLAPSLPVDSLVTRLKAGATLEDLRISFPDAGLRSGRHLVALLALQEEESGRAADALNGLAATPGAPPVTALYADDDEIKDAFFWSHAPAFPMHRVVREEMRGLYRRLPRFFLLEDGVVTEVWETLPPAETIVGSAGAA